MKKLVFILLAWVNVGYSQMPFNNWYNLGRIQTAGISSVANDSCYYISSIAINDLIPNHWDIVFTKMDFNGNVLGNKFLHSDTAEINNYGSSLIETVDGDLVTVCGYDNGFLFVKYSPEEDTIYTNLIDSTFHYHSLDGGQPGRVIQRYSDSTYYFIGQLQDTGTSEISLGVFHLSPNGELLQFDTYIVEPGYFTWVGSDILDVGDGILFSSYIVKNAGSQWQNMRRYIRIYKVDYALNTISTWTDWDNILNTEPLGLLSTSDGGLIFGGNKGFNDFDLNGNRYQNRITKLNSDYTVDWEIVFGDSTLDWLTSCNDIIPKGLNRYCAIGNSFEGDSMGVGWMIEFDIDGQVIWDSYFSFVSISGPNLPNHFLRSITETTDFNYLLTGDAHDVQATIDGNPSRFTWVLKTDSVGCLVPDCQDFYGVEELTQLYVKLYPNPVSNNLFIYLPEFDSQKNEVFRIYDMNGNKISEWEANLTDNTYILNVSHFSAGNYILTLEGSQSVITSEKFVVE